MNNRIRERSMQIFKSNWQTFVAVAAAYSIISYLLIDISDGIFSALISSVVNTFLQRSMACFYLRAYNRGTPDIHDTYLIFTYKDTISKAISIMLVMFAFNFAINAIATLFAFSLFTAVISLIVILGGSIVMLMFIPIWYLYVTNPNYPTAYYFKGSMAYMNGGILDYIGFALGTFFRVLLPLLGVSIILAILPLTPDLENLLQNVATGIVDIYVRLAVAGYISRLIPDNWFAGMAHFE